MSSMSFSESITSSSFSSNVSVAFLASSNCFLKLFILALLRSSNESLVSSNSSFKSLAESVASSRLSSSLSILALFISSRDSCISSNCFCISLAASVTFSNCFSRLSPNLPLPISSIVSASFSICCCAFFIALSKSEVDAVILMFTRFSLTVIVTYLYLLNNDLRFSSVDNLSQSVLSYDFSC